MTLRMVLEGICTPLITSFHADGSFDLDALADLNERLIDAGVHGLISGDINRLHLLVRDYPDVQMSCGMDDQALEFSAWGARNWICAGSNFLPEEHIALYQACELSGGMQQRVGLGRALTADPEIILMDEPFSALDPLIRRQWQEEFRQLAKDLGKSAVFITHDLDEAIRIGDRIAIMKDGVIIQEGTAEQIVTNPADQYVADFVAGISRLHLVKASSVMMPVDQWHRQWPGMSLDSLPRCSPEADIDALIGKITGTGSGAIAIADCGIIVGMVTTRSLLLGVRGDTDTRAAALGAAWKASFPPSTLWSMIRCSG